MGDGQRKTWLLQMLYPQKIMKLLMLENTSKITKSNHQPSTTPTFTTKPRGTLGTSLSLLSQTEKGCVGEQLAAFSVPEMGKTVDTS